jgi:hypothetical protein
MEQVHERVSNPFYDQAMLKYKVSYEKKVKEHNFGSLLRKNADGEYDEQNTMFGKSRSTPRYTSYSLVEKVPRMQVCLDFCLLDLSTRLIH